MKISFYLDTRKSTKDAPLRISFTHNYKKVMRATGIKSSAKDWGNDKPKRSHPNFYSIIEKINEFRDRMIDAELKATSIESAIQMVFNEDTGIFFEEAIKYLERGTGRNTEHGILALKSFQKFAPDYSYEDITPRVVEKYKQARLKEGFSPNGVHSYLRHLTTLWNALNEAENPFVGIRPKKQETINKVYELPDIQKIVFTRSIPSKYRPSEPILEVNKYRYYWMLMFYLGGIDMFDLRNLRYDKHVKGDRIQFRRGKGGSGVIVDNLILPQAQEILDKFDCYPYLVPVKNDYKVYKDFTSKYANRFENKLPDLNLSMKPYLKSARYSFINRGQDLLIDERIVKSLVGHKQNSTHSIYLRPFPNSIKDEAHKRICDLL